MIRNSRFVIRASGFTLLELIVVITIFSMLLSFTVVFLKNASKDLGVMVAGNQVLGILRNARHEARTTASPAWVVLDLKDRSVHALYRETVGEWHLEDTKGTGAFGRDAVVTGGTLVRGRVGQALQITGAGSLNCGEVPFSSPQQGISVEMWFFRLRGAGKQILFTVGDKIEASLEGDRLIVKMGADQVTSGTARIPTQTWMHLHVLHANGQLRLYLNDKLTGSLAVPEAWKRSLPFVVGSSKGGLSGIVDELRLGLVVPRDAYELPGEARFELTAPAIADAAGRYVISFDEEGRLAQSVQFQILSSADKRVINLGPGGMTLR